MVSKSFGSENVCISRNLKRCWSYNAWPFTTHSFRQISMRMLSNGLVNIWNVKCCILLLTCYFSTYIRRILYSGLTKNLSFFFFILLPLTAKNKIVIIIRYDFTVLYFMVGQNNPNTVFKICEIYIRRSGQFTGL